MNPHAPITITRVLPASPETIYDAWLDPRHAAQWLFVSPGYDLIEAKIDPHPGGGFFFHIRHQGQSLPHKGLFLTLDRPTHIAFVWTVDPEETPSRVDVHIAPHPQGSQITLVQEVLPEWADQTEPTRQGWSDILEALRTNLATPPIPSASPTPPLTLALVRDLPHPRELVYQCWTDPAHFSKWFFPDDATINQVALQDGAYTLDMTGQDGESYIATGKILSTNPPSQIVLSQAWQDTTNPFSPTTITVDLFPFPDAQGPHTRLLFRQTNLPTPESRADHADGWSQCLANLAKHLDLDARYSSVSG